MSNIFVVVDIETTGLDPKYDEILEVAVAKVDASTLEIMDSINILVQGDVTLANEYVVDMHTKNELTKDLIAQNPLSIEEADTALSDFMGDSSGEPMVGSSVHFDRSFIAHYLPKFNKKFHYRNIDISSFKEFFKKTGASVPEVNKALAHRALSDVKDTVEELKVYKEFICGQ